MRKLYKMESLIAFEINKKSLGGYVYANTSRQMPNRNHNLKDMRH